MKKLVFSLVVALMFSTTAMAIDIAISSQGGWMGQGHADTEAQEIMDNVTGASTELFTSNDHDALAVWIADHTGNGQSDLLVMFGIFPASIYPAGNAEPDGSLAEEFLDDGNCIINTGDYIFYVGSAGNNDAGGLQNMMDITADMWGDGTAAVVTAEGSALTPSLEDFTSNRPWFLDQLTDGWEAELILAQDTGTRADPAIVKNTITGGRLGIFHQVSNDSLPRGEVISEWINNWYLLNVSPPGQAKNPVPASGAVDVLRDGALSWTPGVYPATHNLYFGESAEDVNDATVPTAAGLTDPTYDHGRLEFDKTYYWRVDEVNTSPDKTVHAGKVWEFEVEPYAIQIPGSSIAVTASSFANDFSMPENTINGSGLGEDNTHGISSETMWFTASVDLDPWIQFEFDTVQKLDVMRVWNSNSAAEVAIGWGVKDVEFAYSTDGENWDVLADANQLSRAPGSPAYNTYDTIAFGGVAAKFVRLNIASNWGGILMSYGLSEVQFDMIPAAARTPDPADGDTGVLPNAVAAWRAGREAAQHTIYVSTDQNEVADGLAPSVTSNTNSVDMSQFDLAMGTTYYWRVDEVNEAEAVSVWAGPVWSFTTTDAIAVDDFESYNNFSPDRPFQSWLDGFGYSADEHFPNGYAGNGTGAGIGHDIWSLNSPHYDGDIMETTIAMPGSGQSMPFYYTNTGGTASETQHTFSPAQDWTVGGAQTLSIAFYGQAGNTGTLYAKINGVKLTYPHDASNLTIAAWQAWNIDLSTVSTNLASITEMAIGVDGGSAAGMILIDDLRLHAEAGELITPQDPGTDGLVALYSFEGNANDSSGNGNNGTVEGGALFVTGQVGSALDCDGTDDFVSTGKTASQLGLDGNNARTISSWVLTRSFNNGGIYDVGARSTLQDFSLRTMATDNVWRIQYWGNDSDFTLDSLDKWVHYTHVHDGVNTKIYANGMLIVDWEITLDTQDTNPFQIGRYGWPDAYFDGLIDEVHVYNRALTAEEALYLAGVSAPIDKPL